ncbi:CYFA0S09e02476g1_1 [Cyberlindnera fabianii]|uniref:amidase n=1 Tax=Cyberlindnera fabianii TaxID=36022 RepID=A0A061B5T4_CYBFA|nr:Acetamidase [Cyberlindnera fabianii]CDR42385.1 CYFA0S09e02476g1_1 [Cyberlindnera fabianii]
MSIPETLASQAEVKRTNRDEIIASFSPLPSDHRPHDTRIVGFLETSGLLSPDELLITNSSALQILEKIRSKQWSCVEVTQAFCHRAALAHQLVNCIAEPLFKQALNKAAELDYHYESTGSLIGPLHGLPFSLKDEFDLEGTQTTLCLISRSACPAAKKSSPNVKILIDAGAIPLCKTTTPIAAFNIETKSNLFGKTLNPWNTNLSPGGSSGGEAALVALRGSPLGVGSDLGGSIRQPASFNGLYGLRMCTQRTTHSNPEAVVAGIESLKPTNGPLAQDLETIELYAELMAKEAWKKDIHAVRKPWAKAYKESLTLAVLYDDAKIEPTVPVSVALKETVKALEKQGHTVLKWTKKEMLSDIAGFAETFMSSNAFKKIVESYELSREDIPGIEKMKETKELTASQLFALNESRSYKTNRFWGEWLRLGIDGLIMPVTAYAGVKFGEFEDVTYSPLANVLDVPACAFPAMKVDDALKLATVKTNSKLLSTQDLTVHSNYNADDIKGMWVGLQVLGPRLEEELVLETVRTIKDALAKR